MARSGPGGAPYRCWIDAKSAACVCFSVRPRATIVEAPRFARNSSSDKRKLLWPRSAAIVAGIIRGHQSRYRPRADALTPRVGKGQFGAEPSGMVSMVTIDLKYMPRTAEQKPAPAAPAPDRACGGLPTM